MDIQVALLPPQKKEQVMKKEILVAGGWDALQVAHVIPYSLNKYNAKKPAEKLRVWTQFLISSSQVDLPIFRPSVSGLPLGTFLGWTCPRSKGMGLTTRAICSRFPPWLTNSTMIYSSPSPPLPRWVECHERSRYLLIVQLLGGRQTSSPDTR